MMDEILENTSHRFSEVICLKCLKRVISVRPIYVRLKHLECECGEVGYMIETGEIMENE